MNLSNLSIKRPVTSLMLLVTMLIFGFISIPKIPIEQYPEMNLPVITVSTTYNAAPTEVENLVTKPIEEALGALPDIQDISSTSVKGSSSVLLKFNYGVDIDDKMQEVTMKINKIRGQLPQTATEPTVFKMDPNVLPIINLTLTGVQDINELKKIAKDRVETVLERINGVASVDVTGGQSRVIQVIPNPDKLIAYGISRDQIKSAITATNQTASTGEVQDGDTKRTIEVIGEYAKVESIGKTPIPVGDHYLTLDQIATITDTYEEISQTAYYNGKPSVHISINKATGGNTIEVADEVKKLLPVIAKDLPQGVTITLTDDASTNMKDSIYSMVEHGVLGLVFSIMILYLFLNSARAMLIVSIVMPISIVATFSLMYVYNITLNMMSLLGLTLGLGSLVDFAVVILENIFRMRQEGKSVLEASLEGSKQVGTAVMASGLAQICVFLPIAFVEGAIAEIFKPLAMTVVFSHIAALVVSMLVVPLLSSRWLDKIKHEETEHLTHYRGWNLAKWFNVGYNRVANVYGLLLGWSLNHRKTVLATILAVFIGSLCLFPLIGMELMPGADQGKINVSIKVPSNTVFVETEKLVKQVESMVESIPELETWSTTVSSGSTGAGNISIQLMKIENRTRSTDEIAEDLRKKIASIPGAEIEVKQTESGPSTGSSSISYTVRGDDLDKLKDVSSVIASEISKVEGTRNVKSSLDETEKGYQVLVDPPKAGMYGLTTSQIISGVSQAFQGETVTQYRTGDEEIHVLLKMPEEYKQDISYLHTLRITNSKGANIPISSVAQIKLADTPQSIERTNMTRGAQITGDIYGRDLGAVSSEIQQRLSTLKLPEGYTIDTGGSNEEMMESFQSLGIAVVLSMVLIYMVMAGQFESLFTPFIIMFSVPSSVIGVLIGLFITNTPLSMYGLIGFIMLIGVVVNNAIVLIDYVNNLRKQGMERNEAIKHAGPIRLRPILMTSLATILAVLPLAFSTSEGSESMKPMGIVVAFGLAFSTISTLVLVPVVYTLFDDSIEKRKARKERKNQKSRI
ncbi:efflux RND transporter permease subunit [Brevibacillus brevis]|uniref:efflux RND transporter permease subunit n=1 Tax=Brevibacillus brevis TaxID=1393 RepID=UPI00115B5BEA|nr:efflux RND transporter permease subunit [Lysinibacillus sp. SDF0063]TQR36411.1 efflux RND transporter permease subunit [Lysinibacillus sp. SDF0063]